MNPRAGGVHPALPFALVVVGISALLAWRFTPDLFSVGALVDPDGYMRLVRVRLLAEGHGWFDASVPRSNWPFGEIHHWSRPLDVLILAGAWLLTPLAGFESALHLSGVWMSTALLVAIFVATVWAAEPVVGRRGRGFVLLALLAQPAIMGYALPGRADHHALIILCFAWSVGFAFRGFADPDRRRWAVGLGVTSALGLWVSPEFLLPLGFLLGAGMLSWIARGGALALWQRRWTGVLASATALAVLAERGPGLLEVQYDRLSVVHVLVGVLAWLVWVGLTWADGRTALGSVRRRFGAAAALGAGALGAMALAFPPFFGGPMVEVTDPTTRQWLGRVTELLPHLMPDDRVGVGLFLVHAGPALLGLVWLARGRRGAADGDAPLASRLLLALGMAVAVGLGVFQARWIVYAQVLAPVALAGLVLGVRARWLEGELPLRASMARAGASAALLTGPLLIGAALVATAPAPVEPGGLMPCAPEAVAAYLTRESPYAERPHTVAAYTDLGPVLLYRTHHRVLATPYHRNQEGIRAVGELLGSTDDAHALGPGHGKPQTPRLDDGSVPARRADTETVGGTHSQVLTAHRPTSLR